MHANGRVKVLSVVLVFVLMLSFVVSGCGSSTGASGNGSSKTAKLSGEFTFVCSQYSDATEPFFTDLISRFQKENPGVKVDLQVVGWDVLEQKVNTMVSTNQAPDLLNIDAYSRYVDDNLLMPADKYVTSDLKNMFYESFYNAGMKDNKVYAIPIVASIRALYYNKDIFAKAGIANPPATWSELKADCQAIREKTGIDPYGFEMTNFEGQACYAYFSFGNGGTFKKDGKWTFNSAENIEAVQFMADLVKNKLSNPQPTAINRDELQKLFGAGKLAMLPTANFFATLIKTQFPDLKYGIAAMPVNDGKEKATLGVEDYLMVFNSCKCPEAVGGFLSMFYKTENYQKFCTKEGMLSATKEAGDAMTKADPALSQFNDMMSTAKFYPSDDTKYSGLRLELIKACQQVILGEKSATDAMNALQATAEK